MLGAIGNINNMVGNAVQGMFGNSNAGQLFGAVAQGLTSMMTGDVFGMFNAAKNAFGSIGANFTPGSAGNLNQSSRLPQLPFAQTPSLGAQPSFGGGFAPSFGGGNSTAGAVSGALTGMKDTRMKMEALMNNKNMAPEDKQMAMFQLQQEMQSMQQLFQMMTNVSKQQHQTAMAAVRNLM